MQISSTTKNLRSVVGWPLGRLIQFTFSAVVMIGICTSTTLAQLPDPCTDDQDEQTYDASKGVKPNDATADPQWDKFCGGVEGHGSFATVSGGRLKIDDNSGLYRASYCLSSIFIGSCDPRQDAVYEIACKTTSENPPSNWPDITLNFICGLRDGLNDFRIALASNEVGFFDYNKTDDWHWLKVNSVEQVVTVNTRNDHLYRVEKDDTEVRLYIDDMSSALLTVPLANLSNAANDNRADLLVTSKTGGAKFEVMHFRYRLGTTDFDPVTPDCAADFDDDGYVGSSDLLQLLLAWGDCTGCEEDLDGDDIVGSSDLLILLVSWGACP